MYIDNKALYKQIAQEFDIPEETVKRVIQNKYYWLRQEMIKAEHVAIFDELFGTFFMQQGILYKRNQAQPDNEEVKQYFEKVKNYNKDRCTK